MTKVFISYRRDDSADITGRIYDRLVKPLGPFDRETIFKDVDSIPLGVNFKKYLEDKVSQCAVQLVVIGPHWLDMSDVSGRRRLDDPADFVRIEIETALKREIPVIPLLVMGAKMPAADQLPVSLSNLVYQNATLVRRDPDFHVDMDRVTRALQQWGVESFTLPMLAWCAIPAGNVTVENQDYRIEAFRISKYPITNGQFQAFVDDSEGYSDSRWWQYSSSAQSWHERTSTPKESGFQGANHPKEKVSWYEAMAFCHWLSYKTKLRITLPTEQQWQRAAQGDDFRNYPWGNSFDSTRCNTWDSGNGQTTDVDSYPDGISLYGVYDMVGNVWEWCLNKYSDPNDVEPGGEMARSVRGDSWVSVGAETRLTKRGRLLPLYRDSSVGFRLATDSNEEAS